MTTLQLILIGLAVLLLLLAGLGFSVGYGSEGRSRQLDLAWLAAAVLVFALLLLPHF